LPRWRRFGAISCRADKLAGISARPADFSGLAGHNRMAPAVFPHTFAPRHVAPRLRM